jgi:membrane associated rhomboid family serine protease
MFLLPLGDDVDHRDFPVGAVLLIMLNVAVLLHMGQIGAGDQGDQHLKAFIHSWALIPAEFGRDHYAGLGSHMFLHGGIMHLVENMFFLWAFAISLELSLGTLRFLGLYLLWGLAGGTLHLLTNQDSLLPMVGASGAIAGVMGAYWVAFGPFTRIRCWLFLVVQSTKVNIPAGAFTVVWLLLQFVGMASEADSGQGGVAWFAHLGGFGAGALAMLLLKNRTKARLVVGRHGDLSLEETPDPRAIEARQAAMTASSRPTSCPYCHTPLGSRDQLASNLLRCPNPTCGRCIYLEEPAGARA